MQTVRPSQTVDKPYEKMSEGHDAPLTGFVSTGYAGRAGWFRSKAKPFLSFFTAVSSADSEKCKLDKVAKPLCRHAETVRQTARPSFLFTMYGNTLPAAPLLLLPQRS